MLNLFLSYASVLAYIAFSADLVMQVLKIYKTKSSEDVAPFGVAIRLTGSCILVAKFFTVNDIFLVVGQGLFSLTVLTYLITVLYYRNRNVKSTAKV